MTPRFDRSSIEWPLLLVLVPVLCNAVWLWPELHSGAPSQSDTAFHALMILQADQAIAAGRSPVDFWIPQLGFGFPQFLYYQHLPHLFVVGLHRLLGGSVELLTLFHAVRWALLVSFPLTVYWSARRLGLSARAAAAAGAASSLLAGDARFGFEYNSYVWRGFGLYTQLWAMHLSFIATALLHRLLRDGRGYASTVIVLAMLALSQLLYAWMAAITALVLLLVDGTRREWLMRAARLAMVGIPAITIAAYMIVPFLALKPYLSTFPRLPGASGGTAAYSATLFSTDILDQARWPVLTLLLLAGIAVALRQAIAERDRTARLLLSGLAVWLVLGFGRELLGPLRALMGTYGADVSYRFIGAAELFAILLMGLGGGRLWDWVASSRLVASRRLMTGVPAGAVAGGLVLLLWLLPALRERAAYYATNDRWIRETAAAVQDDTDLHGILTTLEHADNGRVYAGRRDNWGADLRVGPIIRVTDVIKARALPALVPPYQGLSLNTEMIWQFNDADPVQYDLFDVRHVIVPAGSQVPPFFTPFLETPRYTVYRTPTSGVSWWITVSERRAVASQYELLRGNLAWLANGAPARREFVRWDYAVPPDDHTPSSDSPTSRCAQIGQQFDVVAGRDSLVVETRCDDVGTLLFKTAFHPNWRVTVDDAPARTFMVSPAFLALEVPAGEHTVAAVYTPTPGKHALLVFGAIVLVAVLLLRDRLDRLPAALGQRLGGRSS